jgi:two-component system CheB/CheR fusion protein
LRSYGTHAGQPPGENDAMAISASPSGSPTRRTPGLSADDEALISLLDAKGGFRFASYAPASLLRRIRTRMAAVGLHELGAYCAFMEAHPTEHAALSTAVPVHRTEFFRDAEHWATAARFVAETVRRKAPDEGLRVWSAGCATGEEAYSLAMLLAETRGPSSRGRWRINATDVSADALELARAGRYSAERLRDVPAALRSKYFERCPGAGTETWGVRDELRSAVAFVRHDLLRDPPLCSVDLLVCRNVLLYFTPKARERVLGALHVSLAPDGIWFAGQADGAITSSLFAATSLGRPFFRPALGARSQALLLAGSLAGEPARRLAG